MKISNILFTTPYLGRNGAEISFVECLLKTRLLEDQDNALVSGFEGELSCLVNDFSNVVYINSKRQKMYWKLKSKIMKTDSRRLIFDQIIKRQKPLFAFVNTSVSKFFVEALLSAKIPFVLYSHELVNRLNKLGETHIQSLADNSLLVLTSSKTGKKYFEDRGAKKVKVLSPGINFDNFDSVPFISNVWISSGNLDENKNPDLFLRIAKEMYEFDDSVKFIWIGGDLDTRFAKEIIRKKDKMGLSEIVQFVGWQTEKYHEYINKAHGYLCTSTEESFGISVLEAAYSGLHIVSTPCTGPKETLKEQAHFTSGSEHKEFVKIMLSLKNKNVNKNDVRPKIDIYSMRHMVHEFSNILEDVTHDLKLG